jgi:hypothetical protein
MPPPTTLLVLGFGYGVVSILLWPLTTIISTAFALKLKVPALPALARGRGRRQALRPRTADS